MRFRRKELIPVQLEAIGRHNLEDLESLGQALGVEWTQAYVPEGFGDPEPSGPDPGSLQGLTMEEQAPVYEEWQRTAFRDWMNRRSVIVVDGEAPHGERVRFVREKDVNSLYINGKRLSGTDIRRLVKAGIKPTESLTLRDIFAEFGSERVGGRLVRPDISLESIPSFEVPSLDRRRMNSLSNIFGIEWDDPTFRPSGPIGKERKVGILRVPGSYPGGNLEYVRDTKQQKSKVSIGGREVPVEFLLNVRTDAGRVMRMFSAQLGVVWDSPTGSLSNYRVRGRTPEGDTVSLESVDFTKPLPEGDTPLLQLDIYGTKFSPMKLLFDMRTYRLVGLPLGQITDELGKIGEHRKMQEELRSQEPRRDTLGGPGFYDRYLRRVEKPGKLYHITSRENLESILERGMNPRFSGGNFMGPLKWVSENYMRRRGSQPVILEIDTDLLDPGRFGQSGQEFSVYDGVVPPEAIRELDWVVDYPESGTRG